MTARQVMINTAAALLVIGIALLLLRVQQILVVLIISVTLAAAIRPVVFRLRRAGLSRGQAILGIYATLGLSVVAGLYLLIPPLVAQAGELVENIPDILQNLRQQAASSNNDFLRTTGVRALDRAAIAYENFRANPSVEGSTVYNYATSMFSAVFTGFSVLVVTYYWMTERAVIKRLLIGLFPLQRRDRAHVVWDEIEEKLGGWVRGQLILSVVIGGASMLGYWLIGLDFWLPLGILAGITEVIPILGPIIAGTAAVTIALTESPQQALIVLVFVFTLQQLEGAVLVPRVMRNEVGLSPLSIILAILVGGAIMGPLGAVLAIPVAAAIQVLIQNLMEEREDHAGSDALLVADALLPETKEQTPAQDTPAVSSQTTTTTHQS